MLEPESRVVLLDQLRPPAGYRLDAAVATTFTLGMASALVPPLAFATFDVRDTQDPLTILESVRSCADRVDIFCQAGQISVPAQPSDLMAFLEPMVHPVMAPRRGHLFHPKLWFLRYVDDGGSPAFRLVCSSRNLVDSTAWDCAVTLDGHLGDEPGDPALAKLLRALPDMTVSGLAADRRTRIEELAADAERVRWEPPQDVKEVRFHAWGVPGLDVTAEFGGSRHLVVSPFVDAVGLAHVGGAHPRVVSRQEALDALDEGTVHEGDETTFVLDPAAAAAPETAGPDDRTDDADGTAPRAGERDGLHAKVTVVERGHTARVFLGSPNATEAAYHGNVEAAVELVGSSRRLGIHTLLGRARDGETGGLSQEEITGGASSTLRAFLQPYHRGEPIDRAEEEALEAVKRALRALCAVPFTLTVEARGEDHHLRLDSGRDLPVPEGMTATARALKDRGHVQPLRAGRAAVVLGPMGLTDVTPFVEIEVTDAAGRRVASVVHAPLVGDPPGRLDEVLAKQVDDPEKFLRLLALLLGRDGSDGWAALAGQGDAGGWGVATGTSAGLLEDLVVSLADHPADLEAVSRLVDRLRASERGRSTLPPGFAELWASIEQARERA